jgi:GNAT superfamily N-acetyltransferase
MVALFSPPQCPSREYRGVLRELRQEDADAAARLSLAINPHRVETGERVWQRATTPRQRDWVVDEDGTLAGYAYAYPASTGTGRFWIGGHPDRRGRGLGAELYGAATAHLGEAPRLRTWVDGDPAGERFVRARGFELTSVDRVSELDLRVWRPVPPEPKPGGYRVVSLAESLGPVEKLFARCRSGQVELPDDLVEWKWDELEHPNLTREGSFVVLRGEEPAALGFLTIDLERRVAYNVLTATFPAHRRRGLALLVKLASTRWAAANGIERLLTENDAENASVLALNDRLGYRRLYDQGTWVCRR